MVCCHRWSAPLRMAARIVVTVASSNPVKAQAARAGFSKMFGDDLTILTLAVPSGVPNQPMSDEETHRGARNR